MAQTVIGIFDNVSEARQAVQELKNIGLTEDRIDISSASGTSGVSHGTISSSERNDENDGIGGFFRSLFSDDDDRASSYSNVARHSDCIVTVHASTNEEARRAALILDQYGSVDLDQRATEYGYHGNSLTNDSDAIGERENIQILEENLEVGKREVETGGARLRSRIVERPVEEHLRLRSEHIRVERHAVNRPASEADFNNFKEGEISITEHAEVPVVNKEARVVEEISLGKEVEERDEVIRDTVRSTEVDIERLDETSRRADDLDNNRSTSI